MNEQSKSPGQNWWMGWPACFRILSGAAAIVLVWLLVVLDRGVDLEDLAGTGVAPPRIIIKGAAGFGGLVVLAFLVFWPRFFLVWLLSQVWVFLRWLFSWRMIRRYLYGLGGFAFFAGLFYAEEDWRGKRDWEQYKRAAEAKGERFDLSSFDPPPVPDDQNFALFPIVSNSCLYRMGNMSEVEKATPNAWHGLDIRINARYDWNHGLSMICRATGNV